jgi:Fe-S-cluster containining protein
MPGSLAPGDLERIAPPHEPLRKDWVAENFLASEGTLIMDPKTGDSFRLPTIVPRQKEDGSCVFFENGRCSIHEHSPYGCRMFDLHMDHEQGRERSMQFAYLLYQTWTTPLNELSGGEGVYADAWNYLSGTGRQATPLAERRKAYKDACDKYLEKNP